MCVFPISKIQKDLSDKVGKKRRSDKGYNHSNRDIVEDLLRSSTFEFSKVIRIRNNREPRTLCLDHHENDHQSSQKREEVVHRKSVKIALIL